MIRNLLDIAKRYKIATVCFIILFLFLMISIFAPWLAPNDPVSVDLVHRLQPPSWKYPLGTDQLGRCTLSRLLYGARTSLGFASMIFASSLGIGIFVGIIAGYKGGWVDAVLMRFCESVMAFPNLVLVLGIVGVFGQGMLQLVVALMMVQWVYYARMIRNMVVSLKERTFIAAAKINGSSSWSIMRRHILPNILPSIIVIGTLEMGWAIMDISALSFLGLGIQPPTPEWGAMILEGKSFIRNQPQLMIYPGLMIFIVVMSFHTLGETLSEKLGVKRGL